MDNIDQYDLEFINGHCPEGQVPVFYAKGKRKDLGLHIKIKELYRLVGSKMGHRIPCLPVIDEIVVVKAKKDNYVWAYYATPEERDMLRAEKHRLMNSNFREKFSIHTSCFAFNNDGESNDAFRIPLGNLKTNEDITDKFEQIKKSLNTNEVHIYAVPNNDGEYVFSFSAFSTPGKAKLVISDLNAAHARIQLELLKGFKDYDLNLCDTNGNYYDKQNVKPIIVNKICQECKSGSHSVVKYPKKEDLSI